LTTPKKLLDRLNGTRVARAILLLRAMGHHRDIIYAPSDAQLFRGVGAVYRTTPDELCLAKPDNALAAACVLDFQGGPPPATDWWRGNLLLLITDRLLRHQVSPYVLPSSPTDPVTAWSLRALARTCRPHESLYTGQKFADKLFNKSLPAETDETVYLWSSSGRTAVKGCAHQPLY